MSRDRQWFSGAMSLLIPLKFDGSMVEWADGTLRLPHSTRYPVYIAEESPWLIEPLRAISDPAVRRVDVRGPAGSAKSLLGEMHIAWCVSNEPGMYYYVHQTDEAGTDAMEDRIYPMLEANEALAKKLPTDRHKKRISKVLFPAMSLYCVGANLSAAQSKRVKYLTMEEPHLYKPGIQTAFMKRVEGVRNSKIVTLSTGSVLGDESDAQFQDGTCEEWQVPCQFCNQFQQLTDSKDRLIFERNSETIDENGQFNWQRILPTVRYNCEHCGMDWPNTPESRREQAQRGRYVATNTNAPAHHRSFHYEATAIHYFELSALLMEKMKSSYAAAAGQTEPLRDYMQKRRAMAWDESPSDSENDHDFNRIKGEYLKGDIFDGELTRFLTIDNQAGKASRGEGAHRWFTCRAWGQGESRLIDEGRITTWEELEEKRIALGVEPARTLVDIAFDTIAVQEVCVRYGWTGLWGDNTNKESFPHHEDANGQRVIRKYPFSTVNIGHVGIGKGGINRQARYFFWCQQPIKSMYHRMRSGLSSYRMTCAKDISDAYKKQTSVEFKRQIIGKSGEKKWMWTVGKGKENHLLDCDQMNLVAALLDSRIRLILNSQQEETNEIQEEIKP